MTSYQNSIALDLQLHKGVGLKKQRDNIPSRPHNSNRRVYTTFINSSRSILHDRKLNLNLKRKSPQLTTIIVFQIKPSDIIRAINSSNRMKER